MPSAPPNHTHIIDTVSVNDVERFRRDTLNVTALDLEKPIGICVSGGADSVALLLLAQAAFPLVVAATVDHGLRPDSRAEAEFVAALCLNLGVPHYILPVTVAKDGNVSDQARKARYKALTIWTAKGNLACLMTAHHADDQLETLIMRLNRGSGVGGLAGIRAVNEGVVRPLLHWRKAELETIVRTCGITPIDDPTNRNDHFDRARLRKSLATVDWLDPHAAADSADALSEAETALAWCAKRIAVERVTETGGEISFDPTDVPRELQRRILLACFERLAPAQNPRGDALDRMIFALQQGKITTLGAIKGHGGAIWHLTKAPPRRKN